MGVMLMEEGVRSSTMSVIAAPKKKWIQHYMQGEEPKELLAEAPRPRTPAGGYLGNGSVNLCARPAQFTSVINGSYFTEDRPRSRSHSPNSISVHPDKGQPISYAVSHTCDFDEARPQSYRLQEALLKGNRSPSSLHSLAGHSGSPGRSSGIVDYSELKKRNGAGTREVHNKLEKNRRAHLRECFEFLRKQLPAVDDKKLSNLGILKNALRYVQSLKRKERDFERTMETLAREKITLQQRLASLRKEVSAIPGSSIFEAPALEVDSAIPMFQTHGTGTLTYANLEAHNSQYTPLGFVDTQTRHADDEMLSCSTSTASETGDDVDYDPISSGPYDVKDRSQVMYFHNGSSNSSGTRTSVHARQQNNVSSRVSCSSLDMKHAELTLPQRTKINEENVKTSLVFTSNGGSNWGICIPSEVLYPGLMITPERAFDPERGYLPDMKLLQTPVTRTPNSEISDADFAHHNYNEIMNQTLASRTPSLPVTASATGGMSQPYSSGGHTLPTATPLTILPHGKLFSQARSSPSEKAAVLPAFSKASSVQYMTSSQFGGGRRLFQPLLVGGSMPATASASGTHAGEVPRFSRGSALSS